ERDGSAARSDCGPHLLFAFDPQLARLLVFAPHIVERRQPSFGERDHLVTLEEALVDFRELRAGHAGRLLLSAISLDASSDSLLAASRTWESVTPYQVTRHARLGDAAETLIVDIRTECRRRGLPEPFVTPSELRGVSGAGLIGGARLKFDVAVDGPILLGRSRHTGGGLFARTV
ncbi:MAG: hypothetical protein ACRDKJ_08830, partial [Actinomycetota bacterium]